MPATRALYVYGVVPATSAAAGVAGLPGDAEFVRHRRIAALLRPVPADLARELRLYLLGYADILDRLAEAGPVLPVRFGTTVASRSEAAEQVLAPHHDSFRRALAELAGKTQFTVRARYLGDAAIREVMTERPDVTRLHHHLREAGSLPGAAGPGRLHLGELVARAVGAKQAADGDLLTRQVAAHALAVAVLPSPALDGDRVADLACLVERSRAAGFEAALAELADRWRQRARLRLLGPMAPYDFAAGVVAAVDGGG